MAEPTAEASETSQNSNRAVDQNHGTSVSHFPNHGIKPQHEFSEEQVRPILEVIAATGKFWHEWDKLKGMLSFYLKQVLSQYPEAKLSSEQQISSMGETFLELVKRLDDDFVGGKNHLSQSFEACLGPGKDLCPGTSDPRLTTGGRENEEPNAKLESTQNGVQPLAGDKDEIMTEVQASEVDEDMTIDMETFEEIVRSSETNSTPTCDSESSSL